MKLFQTILAATEFSATSDAAFDEALRLAESSGAALRVIHVYDLPPSAGASYAGPEAYLKTETAARASAEKRLERLVQRARDRGVEAAGILLDGFVSDEIIEAARREKADLLVMGTHGHRGLSRVVLGSVAARVVAKAPCPVLTIRSESAQRVPRGGGSRAATA